MKRTRALLAWSLAGLLGMLLPGRATALDLGRDAVEAGRRLFASHCQTCHAAKYLGYAASLDAEAARSAFGMVPPDLSLIAAARGRGTSGARYVERLLTSYEDTPRKNSVFPGITMPPPIPRDDPALQERARQVAAFLHAAAFPEFLIRRTVGAGVLAYTALLTALLFLLYRSVWKGVPHSLTRCDTTGRSPKPLPQDPRGNGTPCGRRELSTPERGEASGQVPESPEAARRGGAFDEPSDRA